MSARPSVRRAKPPSHLHMVKTPQKYCLFSYLIFHIVNDRSMISQQVSLNNSDWNTFRWSIPDGNLTFDPNTSIVKPHCVHNALIPAAGGSYIFSRKTLLPRVILAAIIEANMIETSRVMRPAILNFRMQNADFRFKKPRFSRTKRSLKLSVV